MARYTSISGLKLMIFILVAGFFTYILGPPLYWHFAGDDIGRRVSACPLCSCDDELSRSALADIQNVSITDCPKNDQDMQDELSKSMSEKLREETRLQEAACKETQDRLQSDFLDMKKTSSMYQKEYEKCNSGMESSEGAREKAQELLAQERKISAMWKKRALKLGYKEGKSEEVSVEEETPDEEKSEGEKQREERQDEEKVKAEDQEDVESISEDMPAARKPKTDQRNVPMSKKNQKVLEEFQPGLAIAHYIVKRAVDNEMKSLNEARQHATELDLL